MGNLCSIFHADFDRLVSLTGSHNKAFFLDKCVFWWQISTYTLGDNKIWFTRKLSDIARDTCLSERTVSRYLEAFEKSGLIERISKLSSSNREGRFSVTKKLYIRVTEKLLNLLSISDVSLKKNTAPEDKCSFLAHDGEIDNDNLASSSYKDKDYNLVVNSTVSNASFVDNEQNHKNSEPQKSVNASCFPVEPMIGERITERLKNYIKGMLKNVQRQYDLNFSDPNRLFAEVIFSVTQEQQWQGISNPHHRVNIIAKLLKQKQWKTPKGFYNHWDVGHHFRRKDSKRMEAEQKMKLEESFRASEFSGKGRVDETGMRERFEKRLQDEYRFSSVQKPPVNTEQKKMESELHALCHGISSEESYLKQLEKWLEMKNLAVSQQLVDSVAMKIAGLYDKKQQILEKMAGQGMQAA